jgi:hypothetical protein
MPPARHPQAPLARPKRREENDRHSGNEREIPCHGIVAVVAARACAADAKSPAEVKVKKK